MLRRHFMINTDSSIPSIPSIPNDEIWYTSSDGNIITPNNVSSLPTIISNIYSGKKGIIKFETDVTNIGSDAFKGCKSLSYVIIPNSVTDIGSRAFQSCSKLANITIPDSTIAIHSDAFAGCSSLTSVTIGNSMTSIREYAFQSCSSLTSVHIIDIAAWCNIDFGFEYSANPLYCAHKLYLNGKLVEDLVIPNGVTSIRDWTFNNCTSLISITIPNGVTSIGIAAFWKCSSLTSVSIPNSVISIGNNAFHTCTNLKNISYEGTIAQWKAITKGTNWKLNVKTKVVHCADGDVAI